MSRPVVPQVRATRVDAARSEGRWRKPPSERGAVFVDTALVGSKERERSRSRFGSSQSTKFAKNRLIVLELCTERSDGPERMMWADRSLDAMATSAHSPAPALRCEGRC
jgi:hypothetical protein